jgi:hypothetical protein
MCTLVHWYRHLEKGGGIKLVLLVQTSSVSEMMSSCKCFLHVSKMSYNCCYKERYYLEHYAFIYYIFMIYVASVFGFTILYYHLLWNLLDTDVVTCIYQFYDIASLLDFSIEFVNCSVNVIYFFILFHQFCSF